MMNLLPNLDPEEVFQSETVLALSRYQRRHRLDPLSALYQAEDIFKYCGAPLPPDNVKLGSLWFLNEEDWQHNNVYICFDHPSSEAIKSFTPWDCSLLLEDLLISEGKFLETKPTIVKYWTD